MYRRYYDGYRPTNSYADKGEIIVPKSDSEHSSDAQVSLSTHPDSSDCVEITSRSGRGFLGTNLEIDDIILIGILIFLLSESDDIDPVLIIVVGYLLLADLF